MKQPKPLKITAQGYKVWEHPKGSGIKIRERKNPSGSIGLRITLPVQLTGKFEAEHHQKPSLEEAFHYAENRFEDICSYGVTSKNLQAFERTEAVKALELIEGTNFKIDELVRDHLKILNQCEAEGLSINEVIKAGILKLKPTGGTRTLRQVADELMSIKEGGHLRERTVRSFRGRSNKICKQFGDHPVNELTKGEIFKWLISIHGSGRTRQNYRVDFGEILRFAANQQYLDRNPLDGLARQETNAIVGVEENRQINILDLEQAKRLLKAAQETQNTPYGNKKASPRTIGMLPAIVLGMFCGLRTEELKRLDWKNVHLDDAKPYVSIGHEIAKKRRKRNVEIPENAKAWLLTCQKEEGPVGEHIHITDFDKRFRKVLQAGEFGRWEEHKITKKKVWHSDWKENYMRHTYGSALYAKTNDSMYVSSQLGHKSDDVLFAHYRELMTQESAEKYFSITPST